MTSRKRNSVEVKEVFFSGTNNAVKMKFCRLSPPLKFKLNLFGHMCPEVWATDLGKKIS